MRLFILVFWSASAVAIECSTIILPPGMRQFRAVYKTVIDSTHTRTEKFTDFEYEVLMDVLHGAAMRVHFDQGPPLTARDENDYQNLKQRLNEAYVVNADWTSEQEKRIRETIFKPACVVLGRPDCDLYDHPSAENRPFNPAQEIALKWAVLHTTPKRQNVLRVQELARANDVTFEWLWDNSLTRHKEHALRILNDVFAAADMQILFKDFVGPQIDANFAYAVMPKRSN